MLKFLLSSRSSFLTDLTDLVRLALRWTRRGVLMVGSCLVRVVVRVFPGTGTLGIAVEGLSDGLLTRPGGIVEGKLSGLYPWSAGTGWKMGAFPDRCPGDCPNAALVSTATAKTAIALAQNRIASSVRPRDLNDQPRKGNASTSQLCLWACFMSRCGMDQNGIAPRYISNNDSQGGPP